MSVIRPLILRTFASLLLLTALPGQAAELKMTFKAKIVAETCTFAATSTTFAFGNIYPKEILDETRFMTKDIAVSSCTGSPQNMKFYLTAVTGSGTNRSTSDRWILVPPDKSYGIETTLTVLNASNQPEGNMLYLPFLQANAVSITGQSMVGKKIRLIANIVPVPGKTRGSDFETGAFTAAATLNIDYL